MPISRVPLSAAYAAERRLPGETELCWIVRLNVRRRREALGLSQRDVAASMGISSVHLCHLERGRNVSGNKIVEISLARLAAFARVLGCEPSELMTKNRFAPPAIVARRFPRAFRRR